MKSSIKAVAGLILVAGALVASSNIARAGEAGAAGSVAIRLQLGSNGFPIPTSASSSIAVGKDNAGSTAYTSRDTNVQTSTAAIGTASNLDINFFNSTGVSYNSGTSDNDLATPQANDLNGPSKPQIVNPGPGGATPTVIIP